MYNSPRELFSSVACGSIWIFRLLFHTHLKQEPIKPDNLTRNNLARALIFVTAIFDVLLQFSALLHVWRASVQLLILTSSRRYKSGRSNQNNTTKYGMLREEKREWKSQDKQGRYVTVRFHGRAWLLTLLWSDAGEFLRLLSEGKLPVLVSSSLFFKSEANGGVEDRFASIACEGMRH